MIVSYNWLKELVEIDDISQEQLVHDLSLYSIEVDSTNKVTSATGLVVGYIESMIEHPNSDHLHICQVNTGSDIRQIVCGAPNCTAGKKVIVALPGAKLPGGEIKDSSIRGVESHGMLCSLQELGIESKYVSQEYAKGIYFLSDEASIGNDAVKELMYDDLAIELGLTPNRMDLMSMLGVARDVAAMYNRPLKELAFTITTSNIHVSDQIKVEIKTPNCLSYYAKIVNDVKIGPSPEFIKTRLMVAGVRPINNVVDITNYCMMLFGQPLHAFDGDKLQSKIVVCEAKKGETINTLDGTSRVLEDNDILICDESKDGLTRPIALGGVMGGLETEVTQSTQTIVLESAVFNPHNIRTTSKRLGLRSESSSRYERGVDLNQSLSCAEYACYLMEKYAGGKVLSGEVHAGISHVDDKVIAIKLNEINDYLGINLSAKDVESIFVKLGFKVKTSKKEFEVSVPNRRMDISIKADLIEEIARMYGYDKLSCTLPTTEVRGELTRYQYVRRFLTSSLAMSGLNEVISYSLVNHSDNEEFVCLNEDGAKMIHLLNPLTEDHEVMRMNVLNSLIKIIKYNGSRQVKDNHFFEIGKIYYQLDDKFVEHYHLAGVLNGYYERNFHYHFNEKVDFFVVKGILDHLFITLGYKVKYVKLDKEMREMHPTRTALLYIGDELIGFVGELHPRYCKNNDLDETYGFEIDLDKLMSINPVPFVFKAIAKVSPVERDLALVADDSIQVDLILDAIYSSDKKLITKVTVFDEYRGENIGNGKKSIAVRITMEPETSMTEEEISTKIARILKSLEFRYHVTLRK